ncbi:Brix-domain-containing protein [Hesseltinella vesiculosa]|uniref:Brix-domain-containing protein n=1 Tax=Hesseltinella vesiculosa TaxID=101127 RepID=A0A1X2GAC7_9FUNG|nr:Brix-domain-containing protein [Hesseltinella vesiculosa]
MRSGEVGRSVTALVANIRRVMEPYTATHLRERRTNRLKDFVAVAGQLGVTNFMIFSRTEKHVNLRIARVPRGPTLSFRVLDYALTKDCLALQNNPHTSDMDFRTSPLLVLNNFRQEGKEFKVMAAMLQNMFPAIDVQTMQLSQARRVLLYNYNEDTQTIDVRHYGIGVKTTGVSKSIKRVVSTHIPNLSQFEDISDYVLKEAIVSESDVEDGADATVTLGQDYRGRNNRKNEQRAVRLYEMGPRMTLQLVKVENGMCDGEVLYNRFVKKTDEELREQDAKRQRTLGEKAQRRQQQQANVEKKEQEREEHRRRTGAQQQDEDEEELDDIGDQDMDMEEDQPDEDSDSE